MLFIFSCKSTKTQSELEYQNCINNKTVERGIFYPSNTLKSDVEKTVSVFDSIKKFENYLKDEKSLSDIRKKGYLSLISKIDETDFLKEEFLKFNQNNYFTRNNLMTSNFRQELLQNCYLSAFKGQIYYQNQFTIYDKVFLNSYANSDILSELANEIDFKRKTQRLVLTFLIYDNLYRKFEMK